MFIDSICILTSIDQTTTSLTYETDSRIDPSCSREYNLNSFVDLNNKITNKTLIVVGNSWRLE